MKWKKLALSGLGAAVVGLAAVMVGRRRRKKSPVVTPIPDPTESFRLRTEADGTGHRGAPRRRENFLCKPTQFRVWGLLDQPAGDGRPGGNPVYLVRPETEWVEADQDPKLVPGERFYATIHYLPEGRMKSIPNAVAVGAPLEFRKCQVGGASNGVETGERVATLPVVGFQFLESRPS